MKTRTWAFASAAVVATALAGGAAIAAGEAAAGDGGMGAAGQVDEAHPHHGLGAVLGQPFHRFLSGQFGRLLVLRSQVELTPAQRSQLHMIVEGHRAEIVQVVHELGSEHRALRNSVLGDKSDEKAVRAAAADLGKGIGDAAVLIAKIKAQAWPVLTPEQRHAIENFRADTDKALDQFLNQLGQPQGADNGAVNP